VSGAVEEPLKSQLFVRLFDRSQSGNPCDLTNAEVFLKRTEHPQFGFHDRLALTSVRFLGKHWAPVWKRYFTYLCLTSTDHHHQPQGRVASNHSFPTDLCIMCYDIVATSKTEC
jgi:hypothetical protein